MIERIIIKLPEQSYMQAKSSLPASTRFRSSEIEEDNFCLFTVDGIEVAFVKEKREVPA